LATPPIGKVIAGLLSPRLVGNLRRRDLLLGLPLRALLDEMVPSLRMIHTSTTIPEIFVKCMYCPVRQCAVVTWYNNLKARLLTLPVTAPSCLWLFGDVYFFFEVQLPELELWIDKASGLCYSIIQAQDLCIYRRAIRAKVGRRPPETEIGDSVMSGRHLQSVISACHLRSVISACHLRSVISRCPLF